MAVPVIESPTQNRILAGLSPKEFARALDDLELVSLQVGQVLYEAGDRIAHAYFPTTCMVSLIFTTKNGSSSELVMTGNDGVVGLALVLGGDTTTHRVVVQSAGKAYRMRGEVMRWELNQCGNLHRLALRYCHALVTQMAQSIVCIRHHSVDQQLCRWLLLSLDRVPGNVLHVKQEQIANLLGVRREGITEAAGKLQTAGLINYSRGQIVVNDRPGLEARACECYATVKMEQDRLDHSDFLTSTARAGNRVRPNPTTLRQRAEAHFLQNRPAVPGTSWDSERLLHELQVHQIELEMQIEELQSAYGEADALSERHADIYDFAPVGYFTLDSSSAIIDLNLAGAILLGITRSQTGRYRFVSSVTMEDRPAFKCFVEAVLTLKGKKRCDITLLPTVQRPAAKVRIEAVPDENGQECRMVVIDIAP